jgi:hypothetical protein
MHSPTYTYTTLEKCTHLPSYTALEKCTHPAHQRTKLQETLKYLHLRLLGNKCAGEHNPLKTEKIREIVSKLNIWRTLFCI